MTITDIAKKTIRTLDHNSPLILTGLAVAGVVSTVTLAVKASFEAKAVIDKFEKKDVGLWIKATPKEKVELTWPLYIPTAAMGAVTIACILGAQSINSKRNAALIGGYSIVENAFREYREKVVDSFGIAKEQRITDDIAGDRIAKHPPGDVIVMGEGTVLCFESYSGRYFMSTMETLRRGQNDINEQCLDEMFASLNDFYRAIGVDTTSSGEEFGWNNEHKLTLEFSTKMTEDNRPCIVVGYKRLPVPGYYKMG